jgi:hypothetical protein
VPSTQEHVGADRPYGKTLLTSFTVLKPHTLSGLSDDELQRYIDGVSQRMEAAHAEWLKSDCFDALGERDRLWLALQAALCERGTRPHLVAQREAEIEARMAMEPGA